MLDLPLVHTAASWKISLFSSPPLLSLFIFSSSPRLHQERGEVGHKRTQKGKSLWGNAPGSFVHHTEGGKQKENYDLFFVCHVGFFLFFFCAKKYIGLLFLVWAPKKIIEHDFSDDLFCIPLKKKSYHWINEKYTRQISPCLNATSILFQQDLFSFLTVCDPANPIEWCHRMTTATRKQ